MSTQRREELLAIFFPPPLCSVEGPPSFQEKKKERKKSFFGGEGGRPAARSIAGPQPDCSSSSSGAVNISLKRRRLRRLAEFRSARRIWVMLFCRRYVAIVAEAKSSREGSAARARRCVRVPRGREGPGLVRHLGTECSVQVQNTRCRTSASPSDTVRGAVLLHSCYQC